MIFFLVFLILFKILGIFPAYQANIPDRFPPETTVTKIGFFVYRVTERIILILNENLRFFPSAMVPLIQRVSVKIFFLKAPFLVADLIILAVVIYLFGKSIYRKKINLFPILSLSLINPWIIFFFNSQRLSFKEKLYQFLFKPYKLSPQKREVIISILGTLFFLLITIIYLKILKKQKKKWLRIIKNVLKSRLAKEVVILSLLFWIVNSLGIFIKISSPESPRWSGYWIWGQTERKRENAYLVFKKEFTLSFSPKRGQVFSFCQDRYRLFLNEKFVGEGGLVSDNSFAYFEKWSVKDYLKKGLNSIRLECHNPYLNSLSLIAKEGGMIFQLEAENGIFKKKVVSDSSWKVAVDSRYQAKTEKVSSNIGFQQFFNANFDSFVWGKAQIIDRPPLPPWEKLVLRPIPFLQENKVLPKEIADFGRFEENPRFPSSDLAIIIGNGFKTSKKSGKLKLQAISITEGKTYLLFDFGRMVVGYPEISLQTSGGATIDFGFAETLKSDGTPDVAKMVSQADQIITKDGNLSYRWFQRRAFRYAILIFKDFKPPVLLEQFLVNTVSYPADDNESSFVSSDKLLNEIFLVAKYNVKIARQGNFEDCPHSPIEKERSMSVICE